MHDRLNQSSSALRIQTMYGVSTRRKIHTEEVAADPRYANQCKIQYPNPHFASVPNHFMKERDAAQISYGNPNVLLSSSAQRPLLHHWHPHSRRSSADGEDRRNRWIG